MAEAAEKKQEEANYKALTTDDLVQIYTKPEILERLRTSQPQETPTNGALFAVDKQSLQVFKNDGYLWAKESNGNRMVHHGKKFKCWYARRIGDPHFKRHIYQMIEGEHKDIFIFYYRYNPNQENRRRGIERIPVTSQSIQEAENVESTGCSSDIAYHNSNQLPLPPQIANTSNLNIQENVESADSQQDTDAEFSSMSFTNNQSVCFDLLDDVFADSVSEDDMLHRDSEIENQSIPQETNNDFLPDLAIPGSLSEWMEYMEPSSEKNNKNLKRGIEILGEHPANRFGEDHMSYQQNPELQKGWNNGKRCKMTNTSNLRNIQASAASGGCVPFEVTQNDILSKPGIPVMPCELLGQFPKFSSPEDPGNYIGDYPSGSIFESLLLPDECWKSVLSFEWPEIDKSELFPEFSSPEDPGNYIGDYPSGLIFEKSPSPG